MSKETAAATRSAFAAKAKKPAPQVEKPAKVEPEFTIAQRNDGVQSHNLESMELDGYLYLRINLNAETTPAKSGKPLISTTRGFVMLGNAKNISLSLNALKR